MRFCSSAAVERDSGCFLWSESPTKTKVPRAWDEGRPGEGSPELGGDHRGAGQVL